MSNNPFLGLSKQEDARDSLLFEDSWRSVAMIDLASWGVRTDYLSRCSEQDCWYDIRCDVFWVRKNSQPDIWLRLQMC